jgi:glycerol-3-phosphate acyltransferase PlsY
VIDSWLLLPVAFLCGSIPFGLLVAKVHGIDIRTVGSGNIGATNVGRVLGKRGFALVFTLDLLKGLLPTLAMGASLGCLGSFAITPPQAGMWLAGMALAVLGHVFCPWLKFKGGKGVATGAGAMLGVFPPLAVPLLGALVVWFIALRIWKTISISSMLAAGSLPLFVAAVATARHQGDVAQGLRESWPFIAAGVALTFLVVFTHRANIQRLRAGTEPKVGQRLTVPKS